MEVCIIIPALNPTENLILYIKKLIENNFKHIIVVDDGSDERCRMIFSQIAQFDECIIITHAVNMGKGRALKDAFNYYLQSKFYCENGGVITVDSDGQHTVEDVIQIAEEMDHYTNSLVLGARDFSMEYVPPKSKYGNNITRLVLKNLIGGNVTDTQTGLRGIPGKLLIDYLNLYGERFEYETNMLIEAIKSGVDIREVKIQTVYLNNNKETHFNPISDSLSIYLLILSTFLKYIVSSLLSFLIDWGLFCIVLKVISFKHAFYSIGLSTFIARVCSSLFNYTLNKNVVFKRKKGKYMFVKYIFLCIVQMSCSAGLVFLFDKVNVIPIQITKIVVDTGLFIISYRIQNRLIFVEK